MNSQLYDKQYQLPSDVIKFIQATLVSNPSGEGVKRAKFMLKNGSVTYQVLKRLKNFFDYFNPQTDSKIQYALAGGDLMRNFIETTLNTDRNAVKVNKNVTRDMTVNTNSDVNAYNANAINESTNDLIKNAVAVIVNNDNKILLLKRANIKEMWMPGKWGLVGGGIEKGETPEKACKREISEETGLDVSKFIKSFSIQRKSDSIEHVFACRYKGEPTDVVLNEENTNYGWYDTSEMKYLDTVPNLMEYITLVFKKYE
jgi:8-oxo-dGTP pyrophosphatase MutT (NUDIX family)